MTLHHLRVFITVCKYNSITKAANELHIAQPAVSRTISDLENHYGVRLFERCNRRIRINEKGVELLNYATHLVSYFDEMEKVMQGFHIQNALKVGTSITIGNYLLPECIKKFSESYPSVDLNVTLDISPNIEKQLLAHKLDFAFIERPVKSPYIKQIPFSGDQLVVFCSTNHPLSKVESISLDELCKQRLCLKAKGQTSRDLFDAILLTKGYHVIPVVESINANAMIEMVSKGMLISVLPFLTIKEYLDKGRIAIIHIKDLDLQRKYYVISHKDKVLSSLEQAFIDICMENSNAYQK